jgi:hypothetical protein
MMMLPLLLSVEDEAAVKLCEERRTGDSQQECSPAKQTVVTLATSRRQLLRAAAA